MTKKLLAVLVILFGASPAVAQSTATPVLPGLLVNTGCPAGYTYCYAPYSNTNPLPVTPVSGASPQDINLKQVNGATVNVGVGTASTGTQRVTTSSDSTLTTIPSSASAAAIAHGQSTATESGHAAICAAACNLYSLTATNLSTTTVLMLMIFNSTTVPADGAVTPDQCLPVAPGPGATGIASAGGPPTRYTTGLSVALSSGASCTTKTASVNGFFTWGVQ